LLTFDPISAKIPQIETNKATKRRIDPNKIIIRKDEQFLANLPPIQGNIWKRLAELKGQNSKNRGLSTPQCLSLACPQARLRYK